MTNKTKIALAATLIVAFATPALAQDGYRVKHQQMFEGRNSGVIVEGGFATGTDTTRESLVRAN
jgi:hypothetical protein